MPRYDLAGNPLPETGAPPPDPAPVLMPAPGPTYRPAPPAPKQLVYAPAPVPAPIPASAPAPPPAPHAILTRGVVQETPAQKVRAYGGLLGTLLLLIALTCAVAAIPAPRIPAPDGYTPYTSQDASLTCDAPDGWKQQGDDSSLSFTYKRASIEVDPAPADSASTSVSDEHAQTQDMLADSLQDDHFQEQAAQPLTTGMGDAMISQWTAAASLSHLHGFRATLMSGGVALEVICVCPQRDWATLQPVFLHVIQSVTPTAATPTQTGGQ